LTLNLGTGFILNRRYTIKTLTIGKLAEQTGVNIATVRYYERRGLIPKPPRKKSGYREYSDETVKRILFIKHAKELGFSLKEIAELLFLKLDRKTPCSEIKKRADKKIQDIEEKIVLLRKMKKALINLTGDCSGHGPVSECPILEALER
jgi:MerR family mercuric resistance operon transcriptional regulator